MKTRSAFTLIEIMIVVAIIGLLASIAIPSIKNSIELARLRTCAANRQNIDGAKALWATLNKKPMDAVPDDADLFGKTALIEHKPDCPAGGTYSLRSVQQKCTCSVPLHVDPTTADGN